MTLWDLLTVLPFGTALAGAIGAVHEHHGRPAIVALMTIYGVLFGALCVVAVRYAGERLGRRALSNGQLRLMYGAAAIWVFAAEILAHMTVTALLAL